MSARGRTAHVGWLQEGMIRGHMLGKTMLPGDEELGKKDDDHKFAPARRHALNPCATTFRWRRKRVLLVVLGLCVGWWLLGNGRGLGSEEGSIHGTDASYGGRYSSGYNYEEPVEPTGKPPGISIAKGSTSYVFDGPIRFYRLRSSIRQSASHTHGYEETNRNVLFAVSSLKSASTLLPMACEMARWSRNNVHFAFMGREDIPLKDLLEINGVDEQKCLATWHDGRPDYAEYSNDDRAEKAAAGALSHIKSYLHPQAIIIDDSATEDGFFVRGIQARAAALGMPLIEVPKERAESLMWLTRLDAGSLKNWHSPSIDIMVQVPADSSGVLRLLRSIRNADYGGLKPPRLILELPANLDQSVKWHVENFQWPPYQKAPINYLENSALSIRRRIANHRATQEDAAIRFLELFYPSSTANSHVLLLSPQAQLSPLYFHYVKYALLEYQYSQYGAHDSRNVMGISLELPPALLDGKSKLEPPTLAEMYSTRYKELHSETPSAPFLWQAPNSHATLFFGAKWAEFHSFLGHRVVKHQQDAKSASRAKLISEIFPAWTEYMLEFMRARGYSLLFPAKSREAFVTVHNELYHPPEEFSKPTKDLKDQPDPNKDTHNEPFLSGDVPFRPPSNPEPRVTPFSTPLHQALPFDGDLPEVPHLPQLLYDGSIIPAANVTSIAHDYANAFRERVGGCKIPKGKHRKIVAGDAGDLFCYGDEDSGDWEGDEEDLFVTKDKEGVEGLMTDGDEPVALKTADWADAVATSVVVADDF